MDELLHFSEQSRVNEDKFGFLIRNFPSSYVNIKQFPLGYRICLLTRLNIKKLGGIKSIFASQSTSVGRQNMFKIHLLRLRTKNLLYNKQSTSKITNECLLPK